MKYLLMLLLFSLISCGSDNSGSSSVSPVKSKSTLYEFTFYNFVGEEVDLPMYIKLYDNSTGEFIVDFEENEHGVLTYRSESTTELYDEPLDWENDLCRGEEGSEGEASQRMYYITVDGEENRVGVLTVQGHCGTVPVQCAKLVPYEFNTEDNEWEESAKGVIYELEEDGCDFFEK